MLIFIHNAIQNDALRALGSSLAGSGLVPHQSTFEGLGKDGFEFLRTVDYELAMQTSDPFVVQRDLELVSLF